MIFIIRKETRGERRGRYAREGISKNKRAAIRRLRDVQRKRIVKAFMESEASERLCTDFENFQKDLKSEHQSSKAIASIPISIPLRAEAREVLSNQKVRELALRERELDVRRCQELLKFAKKVQGSGEKRKRVYPSHLKFLERELTKAQEKKAFVERALKSLES